MKTIIYIVFSYTEGTAGFDWYPTEEEATKDFNESCTYCLEVYLVRAECPIEYSIDPVVRQLITDWVDENEEDLEMCVDGMNCVLLGRFSSGVEVE